MYGDNNYNNDNNNLNNAQYNSYNYNTNNGYQNGGYNQNNFTYNQPKKTKKSFRQNKKSVKILSAVACMILIAVIGGTIGGVGTYMYIKNNGIASNNHTGDYAAPEFASSTDGSMTISEAFQKVKPAVVTITTKSSGSTFYSEETEGMGSGFIINSDGCLLTNYHVIKGADNFTVTLSDGTQASASVVNYDEQRDVAMLKLAEGTEIPGVAELGDSDALYAGEDVIAIGTPLDISFAQTLTKGVISAPVRTMAIDNKGETTLNVIQTDTAINPGNSGGPLVNTKGQVIGINSSKIANTSGTSVEGIGFAIPINEVKDRIETLSKKILTLGVNVRVAPKSNKLSVEGLYVVSVTSGSAAYKAGIKAGDIITEFNGNKITTTADLTKAKNEVEIGQTVKVVVNRNNKDVELNLTFSEN
ncbi:MAG: trypsin-like peptidase domain-containing protein [Clostridiaceae bacterium]|nr:trypsin-like peptidase domain-containing protein [Clostridiaceae bacterium]